MNPILMRYVGFALVAVIAGAGGGYLAVNNKKASPPPVVQSGTIPAIPAQPFPGEGIPAIPAIPAIPSSEKPEPKNAPSISHIQFIYGVIWTGRANDIGAGRIVSVFGTNFSPKENTVNWDGIPIVKNIGSYNDRTRVDFQVPKDAQPGSTHNITVTTPRGTSNNFTVRVVEYTDVKHMYWGVRLPASGPIGTKIEMSIQESYSPYQYASAEHYTVLTHPKFGAIVIPTPMKFEFIGSYSNGYPWVEDPLTTPSYRAQGATYSVVVPNEAVYCPTFIKGWPQTSCSLGAPDTKVPLKAGEKYFVHPFVTYHYPNSDHSGWLYPVGIFPELYSRFFTITP